MADIYVATTGDDSTGDGSSGNPYATPGKAASVFDPAADTVYVKNGTYVFTTSTPNVSGGVVDITGNGSDSVLGSWIGYDTNASIYNTDATRPIFQAASSGLTNVSLFKYNPGSTVGNLLVRNIRVDGQAKTGLRGWDINGGAAGTRLENCTAENCTNNGFLSGSGRSLLLGCYATGCSGMPAFGGVRNTWIGCWADANSVTGFEFSSIGGVVALWCISSNNSGGSSDGFSLPGGNVGIEAINCTAYSNGRDGFRNGSGNARGAWFTNCISYLNGGYGFNGGSSPTLLFNCAGGGPNTSGNTNSITHNFGFVSLSANPFTNAGSGDFSLNNTAGGGADLRAAGFPGTFPGGLAVGHIDIGAVQHQDSGGGGGSASMMRPVPLTGGLI